MGTKHDILTEEELAAYSVNPAILRKINSFVQDARLGIPKERINILDWGCGRGRAVTKLLDQGFNAYGVDIDTKTLRNGYQVLRRRSYAPSDILMHVEEAKRFEDGFFHIIFSWYLFEHVENLWEVAREMSRLTAAGGVGVHRLPGPKDLMEGHLYVPMVHWLPKNVLRKVALFFFVALGKGPKKKWGKGFRDTVNVYYKYLNRETYYRDVRVICEILRSVGFEVNFTILTTSSTKWLPLYLRRIGFPRGALTVHTVKKSQYEEPRPSH